MTSALPAAVRAAACFLAMGCVAVLPCAGDAPESVKPAASPPEPARPLDLRLRPASTGELSMAWADIEAAAPEAIGDVRARGEATLADAYRLALAISLRVGQAREQYLRARADLTTARAQILPYVSLEDTYFKQNKVTIGASSGAGLTFADQRNEALVRVQQPIFSGLREHYFASSARATVRALRHGLDDAGRLLFEDTAGLFYDALQSDARVKTLQDTVRVERERVREIDARREVGLARRTEVLLAQSQLGDDESLLTGALNDSLVARQRLALLAGVPAELPLRDEIEIPEGPDATDSETAVEALLSEARENRADLKQAHNAVDAARAQVSFARGGYYPTVGLNATWILDRYNFSEFNEKTDWTAEVDFRFPVFDGGRTRASVARSRSTLRDAEIARDDLERRIRLDVHEHWLTLQSGLAQLKTDETRLSYADENYRLIREEYREGLATNLEVITAQNQYLSARLDLDRQRYQNKLDWVGLRVAQGLLPDASVPESAGPGGAGAR